MESLPMARNHGTASRLTAAQKAEGLSQIEIQVTLPEAERPVDNETNRKIISLRNGRNFSPHCIGIVGFGCFRSLDS